MPAAPSDNGGTVSAPPRYEILDDRFRPLVLPNAALVTLGTNYGWLEGPVWFADHDCLYVSDLPNDRTLRWTDDTGLSVFRAPACYTNGHTRDRQGRLVGCSHQRRHIQRTELDGSTTVLASEYRGRRLNSPNDLVVKRDGTVWFTDPPYGINTDYEGGKQASELPANVYRLDPDTGTLTVVADDFEGPNGLCFSPDESLLYIVETGIQFVADPTQHIRVFDVAADGASLSGGRVFHRVSPGNADGIRCDDAGNVWSSADDGVHCIAPDGTLLGKVLTPTPIANLTFGDRHHSRLFLCGAHNLYAIFTNSRGADRP